MSNTWLVFDVILETTLRVAVWALYLHLERQPPVIRHIDEDEMWHYRYPSLDSIVTKHYLYGLLIVIPITIFVLQYLIQHKDRSTIPDIFNAIKGITLAYAINGMFTASLKLTVGRPRPNFFLRCFPDGYGTDIDNCTGEYRGMIDGRKSFPSGHSSFATCAVVYATLHLWGLLDLRRPRFCRGIIIFMLSMLLLSGILVGVSRTADYHHHFSDVIAGILLGAVIASVTYYCYPPLDDVEKSILLHSIFKSEATMQ